MPGCIISCSCISSPTPAESKEPPGPKWIELKGYCVTCTSQEDIRPPKEDEPKKKMSAKDVVMARKLLKELGITQNPWQNPIVTSTNCGLPRFPVGSGERETNV